MVRPVPESGGPRHLAALSQHPPILRFTQVAPRHAPPGEIYCPRQINGQSSTSPFHLPTTAARRLARSPDVSATIYVPKSRGAR
ncbi:hypothetical protein [Deinococcus saxicola]|uniref:hypothetical protein n=1 Tax=Deinococcus saxicola TaxID=249406 RepID=UPI0039F10D36